MGAHPDFGVEERHVEALTIARGIATAVAPEGGLTDVQADLLEAIASALAGVSIDYRTLEPLGPEELADVLAGRAQRLDSSEMLPPMSCRCGYTATATRVLFFSR